MTLHVTVDICVSDIFHLLTHVACVCLFAQVLGEWGAGQTLSTFMSGLCLSTAVTLLALFKPVMALSLCLRKEKLLEYLADEWNMKIKTQSEKTGRKEHVVL